MGENGSQLQFCEFQFFSPETAFISKYYNN